MTSIVALHFQEERRKAEETEAQLNMQLAQEAVHAKLTRDISNEVGLNCPLMSVFKIDNGPLEVIFYIFFKHLENVFPMALPCFNINKSLPFNESMKVGVV